MEQFTPKRRWMAAGLAAVLAGGVVTTGTGIAAADGNAPPGNNGHIQIDEFLMDGGNGNNPHVACGFSVTFFGYDAGAQHATIDVTPAAPTAGGTPFSVPASWTTDTRTSGNQLDANVPISPAQLAAALKGITPANQGFHVRVDVTVTGSQGADGKHKMLWVEPCATPEQAANTAAVTAINGGATPDEARASSTSAAV